MILSIMPTVTHLVDANLDTSPVPNGAGAFERHWSASTPVPEVVSDAAALGEEEPEDTLLNDDLAEDEPDNLEAVQKADLLGPEGVRPAFSPLRRQDDGHRVLLGQASFRVNFEPDSGQSGAPPLQRDIGSKGEAITKGSFETARAADPLPQMVNALAGEALTPPRHGKAENQKRPSLQAAEIAGLRAQASGSTQAQGARFPPMLAPKPIAPDARLLVSGLASQREIAIEEARAGGQAIPAAQPSATVPIAAPHMPQQTSSTLVAQQIAGAFVRSDGGRTEISLNPEELGRVRFAMVVSDTGMTFVISAERAETADLMRRNLEDLAREFRELGYQNLTFSFEDHPQDGREAENDRSATFVPMPDDLPSLLEQSMARRPMQGTLDLKL